MARLSQTVSVALHDAVAVGVLEPPPAQKEDEDEREGDEDESDERAHDDADVFVVEGGTESRADHLLIV